MGAGSFKRLLGCAPMPVLGSSPAPTPGRRDTASLTRTWGRTAGWTGARTSRVSPPPCATILAPTGNQHSETSCTGGVFTTTLWFCFLAQPNESRLSCGAELEGSQGEFYHTASKTFSGSIGDGRRQLQALVRLRTTSHSSGPSLSLSRRSTHRPCPGRLTRDAEWTDAPNRPG